MEPTLQSSRQSLVAGAIAVVYLAEMKFNVTGFPPVYLSSAAMVFAMCLNTYALVKAVLSGPNPFGFASACASRGLLLVSATWFLSYSHFERPDQDCFINTAALFVIQSVVGFLACFVYLDQKRAKAGGLILVIVGVITGVLFQQNYLMIPDTIPLLSLWYCCNIATVLDGLLVLALDGWQTDFLGVKPEDTTVKDSMAEPEDNKAVEKTAEDNKAVEETAEDTAHATGDNTTEDTVAEDNVAEDT